MFKDSIALDRQLTAASFEKALDKYSASSEGWYTGTVGSVDARLAVCQRLLHSARATVARLTPTAAHRYLQSATALEEDRRALVALREDLLTGASGREDVTGPPGWRTAHWFDQAEAAGFQAPTTGPHPKDYSSFQEYQQARNLHEYINQSRAQTPGGGDVSVDESWANPHAPAPSAGPQQLKNPVGGNPYRRNPEVQNIEMQRHQGALNGADTRWVTLEAARFVSANTDAADDTHELATRAHDYAAMKTSTFTPARSAAICEQFVARVASLGQQSYRPRVAHAAPFEDFDAQAIYLC